MQIYILSTAENLNGRLFLILFNPNLPFLTFPTGFFPVYRYKYLCVMRLMSYKNAIENYGFRVIQR